MNSKDNQNSFWKVLPAPTTRKDSKIFSLDKTSRNLFLVSIMTFIIIGACIGSIVYSIFMENKLEENYSNLIRKINSFVITVQKNPRTVSPDLLKLYGELKDVEKISSIDIGENLKFPRPVYSGPEERKEYRNNIKNYSTGLRISYNNIKRHQKNINLILLSLSLIIVSINLYKTYKNRKYQELLVKDINLAVSSINDLLQYKDFDCDKIEQVHIEELKSFYYELQLMSQRIQSDQSLLEMDIHGDLNGLLKQLYENFKDFLVCDRVSLAFLSGEGIVTYESVYTTYWKIKLEPGFSEKIEESEIDKFRYRYHPHIINDLNDYGKEKDLSEALKLFLAEGVHSIISVPLFFHAKCVGFLFVSTREGTVYSKNQAHNVFQIVNIMKQKLYIEFLMEKTISETCSAFVSLVSEKDNETFQHIKRMSHYSYIIGKKYKETVSPLPVSFLRELLIYAPLHDIGKIGIPDDILHKPGRLSDEERAVMEKHVLIGEKVVKNMDEQFKSIFNHSLMDRAVEIISGHHEKYDGSGYPRGVKAKNIPLAGRIVAAADVFDALTSKRIYKEAMSIEEAIFVMKTQMNGHFDTEIVKCLEESIAEILPVYEELKEV